MITDKVRKEGKVPSWNHEVSFDAGDPTCRCGDGFGSSEEAVYHVVTRQFEVRVDRSTEE